MWTHEISVLRLRVALLMLYRMNIAKTNWLRIKTLEIGGKMTKNRLLHVKNT